ncbi:MAG: zinc ribbon domain-containing protein [bacterium]
MNPQLEYMIQLQEIDFRIRVLDREISLMPEEIEKLRENLQNEEEAKESAKIRLEELEKDRRKKERELESEESKLSKFNTQLLSVKTNKEYTAMLHEIQQCKDLISSIEEDILQLFDHLEDFQTLLKSEEQKVSEKRKIFEEEKSRIETGLIKAKSDLADLVSERKEIEEKIEKELLSEYNKLYEARRGLAIVRAKDGACSGCNLSLMPQLFEEIKTDENRIFHCPNCHRILFYNKEEKS